MWISGKWFEIVQEREGNNYGNKMLAVLGRTFGIFYYKNNDRMHVYLNTNTRPSILKKYIKISSVDLLPKANNSYISKKLIDQYYYNEHEESGLDLKGFSKFISNIGNKQGIIFWFSNLHNIFSHSKYSINEDKFRIRIILVESDIREDPNDRRKKIIENFRDNINVEFDWQYEKKSTYRSFYLENIFPLGEFFVNKNNMIYIYRANLYKLMNKEIILGEDKKYSNNFNGIKNGHTNNDYDSLNSMDVSNQQEKLKLKRKNILEKNQTDHDFSYNNTFAESTQKIGEKLFVNYLDEELSKNFDRKFGELFTKNIFLNESLLIILNDEDLNKAIKYMTNEKLFYQKIFVFNNIQNYKKFPLATQNKNLNAFIISEDILTNVNPPNSNGITRTAHLIALEIIGFIGNISKDFTCIAVIYDFYEIIKRIKMNNMGNMSVNKFIHMLVDVFKSYKIKVLFLTSKSNISSMFMLDIYTLSMLNFDKNENIDVLKIAENILNKTQVKHLRDKNGIIVNNVGMCKNEWGNDCYIILNNKIQRKVGEIIINFSILDGIKEFLDFCLNFNEPLQWVKQLLNQMKIDYIPSGNSLILNNMEITSSKPENGEMGNNTVYIDNDWIATMPFNQGTLSGPANLLIPEVISKLR